MTEITTTSGAEVTSTALTRDPTGGRLVAWSQAAHAAHNLGQALCKTAFVPKHFADKPAECAAAILFGDEVGLSPAQSLRSIFVISGTPGMYARSMVALVLSRGHEMWTEKSTDEEVVVCGRRQGSDHAERVAWTLSRARKAGYTSNKKYETDPQAMLYARAAGDVCRRIAPDALAGLDYTVEELEADKPTPARKVQRTKPEPPPATPEPQLEPKTVEAAPPVTDAQLKKMHAAMTEAGITEREARLTYVTDNIGREVETSKDLTKTEASTIIESLEQATMPEPALEEPEQ
ncbi:MAG: hypothetical protein ACRDQA_26850 [Nocardioidaceae bacterium]